MNCTWNISVPSGYSIELKFKTFEVKVNIVLRMNNETNESICFQICNDEEHYVEIFDLTANNTSRLTGRELPNDVRSTGNQLIVNFFSDRRGCQWDKGFSAFIMKGIIFKKEYRI